MDEATRERLNRNMIALADGERSAFDPAYRCLWPLLVRFIAAVSGDRSIAEDMAQRAMLKIFSRASTFDRSQDALAWSMRIAHNEYRSYRRKPGNRQANQPGQPSNEPRDDDTPETIAIRNNLSESARTVLGELRPHDLEVIVASICESERPAMSAAAFRKRLQRALANARLIWNRHYGEDNIG